MGILPAFSYQHSFQEASIKRSEKIVAQNLIRDDVNSKKVVASPLAALSSRVYSYLQRTVPISGLIPSEPMALHGRI